MRDREVSPGCPKPQTSHRGNFRVLNLFPTSSVCQLLDLFPISSGVPAETRDPARVSCHPTSAAGTDCHADLDHCQLQVRERSHRLCHRLSRPPAFLFQEVLKPPCVLGNSLFGVIRKNRGQTSTLRGSIQSGNVLVVSF